MWQGPDVLLWTIWVAEEAIQAFIRQCPNTPNPPSQGPWSWHTVLVIKDIARTARTLNEHLNIIYIIIIRLGIIGCLKRAFHCENNSFLTDVLSVHTTGSYTYILEETLCQWRKESSCSLEKKKKKKDYSSNYCKASFLSN